MREHMYCMINTDGSFAVVRIPWRIDNRAGVIPATDARAFDEPSMYEVMDGRLVRKSTESEVITDGGKGS
jgi:hypothetical protein